MPLGERAKNGAPAARGREALHPPPRAGPLRGDTSALRPNSASSYTIILMEEEQPAGGSAKAQQALQETTEPQLVAPCGCLGDRRLVHPQCRRHCTLSSA